MPQKPTAISLLILLLASQFGHHILFSIQDWSIRQEQQRRIMGNIPDACLARVEDDASLKWEEPGQEFEQYGQMYDVVRTRIEQGKTIFYAIPDGQEEDLIKTFSGILHLDPNEPLPSKGKISMKLQIPVFTIPEAPQPLQAFEACHHQSAPAASDLLSRPRSVLPCPPWA